jgi:hypothetical protein
MNQGKDYHAAWETTGAATDSIYSTKQVARAEGLQDRSKFK